MRDDLKNLKNLGNPEHLALAYDAWAPVGDDGKVPKEDRSAWLSKLAETKVSPDYKYSFNRWEASFKAPGDRTFRLKLASRLLIGHGNSSAAEVGISVHHTWGVPVIPGSALKGLLAHYVDATYGPFGRDRVPENVLDDENPDNYRGVVWNQGKTRVQSGPGKYYRALFGAPDADDDKTAHSKGCEAGATAGVVRFHDALYVPTLAGLDRPFAVDVLTVHQVNYYKEEGETAPNDYDDPNPVGFLTVRPDASFLFALSGREDWTKVAMELLWEALDNWGVGGKTSAGYGRFDRSS